MDTPRVPSSALFIAVAAGKEIAARVLLQQGASVNLVTTGFRGLRFSSLMIACILGRLSLIKLLLEYGADVDLAEGLGDGQGIGISSMTLACKMRRRDIVGLLIGNGANVNEKLGKGHSPCIRLCFKVFRNFK